MQKWSEGPAGESVVATTITTLRAGIADGRYVPGQRLIEAELARELGISRGPIREALQHLAADGLVHIERHRGAVVRRFSRSEVADRYQVRELLEGLAARTAAERIDEDGNRERFLAGYEAISRYKDRIDSPGYMDANIHFHRLMAELGGNLTLADLVAQFHLPVFRLQFRLLIHREAQELSFAGHDEIAAAILAGDPNRAERAMRRHVRRSGKVFLALPDAAFDTGL